MVDHYEPKHFDWMKKDNLDVVMVEVLAGNNTKMKTIILE